jgi:hypothetical protein
VHESTITNAARVTESISALPAGEYVLVPSTFEPGVERSFDIEVAPAARVVKLVPALVRC